MPSGVSTEARLVRLFAELGSTAHYSGLYFLPLLDITNATGLRERSVVKALDQLQGAGLLRYDRARMLVFVPGALYRQLGVPALNDKQQKGLRAYIERLPSASCSVRAFIDHYELETSNRPNPPAERDASTPSEAHPDAPHDTGTDTPADTKGDVGFENRQGRGVKEKGESVRDDIADAPSPPFEGGEGAASKGNGNGGTPSGKGQGDATESAITHAIVRVECKEWTPDQAFVWLTRKQGFDEDDARERLGVGLTP